MEGSPTDFGDWGLVRIFHEGGRLMTRHFRVFLPFILRFIFPASLISVICYQFLTGFTSRDSKSRSFSRMTLASVLQVVVFLVPMDFNVHAANMMLHDMKTVIYNISCSESAGGGRNENNDHILRDLFCSRETFNGRKPKALGVGFLCLLIYVSSAISPINYTPERVAEMGLPSWTVLVFALLFTLLLTAITLYLILVMNLVFRFWMYATSETPILT